MPSIKLRDNQGGEGTEITLSESVFGQKANIPLLHQAALAELANKRAGTHDTKERSEVRGGGKKPFKQKGTGRARQGTSRAPQMRGGGTVFGPTPHSYRQQLNKKMKRAAIRQALSDLYASGKVCIIENHGITEPKTRNAAALIRSLGLEGKKTLFVTEDVDRLLLQAMRNLRDVQLIPTNEISLHQLLDIDGLVLTSAALKKIESMWGAS